MIYITGDTHNVNDMSNLSTKNMKLCCMEQGKEYSEITYAIVLGDFGLPWCTCPVDEQGIHPTDKTDKHLLKWYNEKPFKILAVPGNHDNYDMIAKLPQVPMFGATVGKVSENVFYLNRGEIYEIEGKRFLILGGALSEDKAFRTLHESWWPQERWTEAEQAACIDKIQKQGTQFDYVLSHTGPTPGIACIDPYFSNEDNLAELALDSTVVFNDKIDSLVTYKKWFFGHWHSDWGYENYESATYIALYRMGVVI